MQMFYVVPLDINNNPLSLIGTQPQTMEFHAHSPWGAAQRAMEDKRVYGAKVYSDPGVSKFMGMFSWDPASKLDERRANLEARMRLLTEGELDALAGFVSGMSAVEAAQHFGFSGPRQFSRKFASIKEKLNLESGFRLMVVCFAFTHNRNPDYNLYINALESISEGPIASLFPKERRVLACMMCGFKLDDIREVLGPSSSNNKTRIYDAFGVSCATQAAILGLETIR